MEFFNLSLPNGVKISLPSGFTLVLIVLIALAFDKGELLASIVTAFAARTPLVSYGKYSRCRATEKRRK